MLTCNINWYCNSATRTSHNRDFVVIWTLRALSNYRHLSFTQCFSLTTSSWPAAKHTLSQQQCEQHQTAPCPPQQTPSTHFLWVFKERIGDTLNVPASHRILAHTMYTFISFRLRVYFYLHNNSGIKNRIFWVQYKLCWQCLFHALCKVPQKIKQTLHLE